KHPIAFDSCKLLPAELNYEIHDKKLLGIVWALKLWRAFLLSLSNSFEVLTDHSSLQFFMSSKVHTCCQACWAEFLSEFHFTITYGPGRVATFPDALSRQDNMYPERGMDFASKNPQNFHKVIKQDGIQELRFFSIKVEIFSDLVEKIQKEVWQDKEYKEMLKQLARGESVTAYSFEPQAKLLLFKDRVVIPRNEEINLNILQKGHDSPFAGHPGQEKTLKIIKRDFHWAGMNQFIKDYVSSSGPWNSVSMDFITQLHLSKKFHSILVVVEGFSKMATFIPTYGTITALESAEIFISHVFVKHGLAKLKISRYPSTAFHPGTDGQTERVNQTLEQYLWINPRFDSVYISQDSPDLNLSTELQSVQKVVKEELESAIRRFKKYANRNRSIPPHFQPGDKVWLASKNIKTTRPTKKLSERWMGPFESSIPHCNQLPLPPGLVEEQEEWEVAQVLDSKLKRGKLWYLEEWKGFSEDPERTTREPASNLTSSPDLFKDFH
ncbi:hypothetical protein O181_049465, partial [Austropuccinia psidii MF-1]|nr:hypothetical protein [Austropuccinia psidii MF-1]